MTSGGRRHQVGKFEREQMLQDLLAQLQFVGTTWLAAGEIRNLEKKSSLPAWVSAF